ncbi:MAG TPA: CDP-alcohol phosphatidyltransferase family protein [Longimicrobiales bacterium]|nr:CDP-alcohol phosphatidyltransferase family protein [Longimicrobiales bacterium]
MPNVICGLRILGVGPLLWAAHQDHRQLFFWIMVLLLLSDWADGTLASVLDQRTELGARLDSAADAVMYASLSVSFLWMEGDVVRKELTWFLAVLLTWGLSGAVGLVRFGRMPSYHTWSAKVSWLMAGAEAVAWLLAGLSRAVPWVLALVILTNLEAVAIGLVLPGWRADVPSVVHALRIRRGGGPTDGSP